LLNFEFNKKEIALFLSVHPLLHPLPAHDDECSDAVQMNADNLLLIHTTCD